MDETTRPRSPLDLLSQLNRRGTPVVTPRGSSVASVADLSLDFSDLASPTTEVGGKGPETGETHSSHEAGLATAGSTAPASPATQSGASTGATSSAATSSAASGAESAVENARRLLARLSTGITPGTSGPAGTATRSTGSLRAGNVTSATLPPGTVSESRVAGAKPTANAKGHGETRSTAVKAASVATTGVAGTIGAAGVARAANSANRSGGALPGSPVTATATLNSASPAGPLAATTGRPLPAVLPSVEPGDAGPDTTTVSPLHLQDDASSPLSERIASAVAHGISSIVSGVTSSLESDDVDGADPVEHLCEITPETLVTTATAETSDTTDIRDCIPPYLPQPNEYLQKLFDRVNNLLGGAQEAGEGPFSPQEPDSLISSGLTAEEIERLALKYLLSRGSASGKRIAQQLCLPFAIIEPLLKALKMEQLVVFKGAATMGDYEYALTELGRERARRYNEECTYFGAAPVTLPDYLRAMAAQSIAKQHATEADLKAAFGDLIINRKMLDKLGPAINSGRGMFLFGEPGNGKTSIAERITACFGTNIWIPRALGIDGDIIRVFDPAIHELVDDPSQDGLFNLSGIDQRWVHIRRPTVIVGGELTMAELEVKQNLATKICESPVQLKSNCGTLVIDDFGRQRMPVSELLNRWIVPLEKRYDFLNLPCGKKIQVPFDQIIIFSTNLEPRDLVDGAFLRRIPYKIQVPDPSPDEFHGIFEIIAPLQGFKYDRMVVDYLLERHYYSVNRPLRACQPRDLLLQVRNFCLYHNLPKVMTPEAFDFAVENYFSVM